MSTTTTSLCATPPIQWGIIGLGDVCTIKSGPAFYKSTGSKLIAVMRRTPGAAQQWVSENREVVQKYNNRDDESGEGVELRGYDNIQDMIAENIDQLDAIYVATPPGVHLENVRQIISALEDAATTSTSSVTNSDNKPSRLKAIYMEKPCGRSAWETRVMIDELHHRHIQFFPAYVSRAHERTQVLRNLLSSTDRRIIGDQVTKVQYTQRGSSSARGRDGGGGIPWRLAAEYSGGGLVMDMGCHVLDRMDYLFGPIVDITSTVLRKGNGRGGDVEDGSYPLVEDYVSMQGRIGPCDWAVISSEGAGVECLWDFSPPDENDETKKDEDELIITGTNGSLRMAGMGAGLPIEVLDVDGNVIDTIEFEAPMHAAQPLIQSIVNELRGIDNNDDDEQQQQQHFLDRSPARAENAVRTSEVLDTILNSYYGGRHDEFWTRPESWPGLK